MSHTHITAAEFHRLRRRRNVIAGCLVPVFMASMMVASAGGTIAKNELMQHIGSLVCLICLMAWVLLAISHYLDLRRHAGRWTWRVPEPPAFANPVDEADDPGPGEPDR